VFELLPCRAVDSCGVGMSADIGGSIVMSAGVGGTLDSGKINLFETSVDGLDIPGYVRVYGYGRRN